MDQRGGGLGQRLGRFAARRAETIRGVTPAAHRGVNLAVELLQAFARALELIEFAGQTRLHLDEFLGRDAVLAREFVQAAEALFQGGQLFGIDVEIVAHLTQQQGGLVELDRGGIEQRVDLAQPWLVRAHAREIVAQRLQRLRQTEIVVTPHALERGVAGLDQAGRVRMPAMAGEQVGHGIGGERLAVEFVELVTQPVAAFGDIADADQGIALVVQRAPRLRGRADLGQQRSVAGLRIEQRELAAAGEQGLVLVLAVDLDQVPGQIAELGDRRRPAVDPGP